MPRPRKGEPTKLGAAMRKRRGERSLQALADEIGLDYSTLSRVERGVSAPTAATARALAKWLRWSLAKVFDAAEERAG